MRGYFVDVSSVGNSVPPRLRFQIEVEPERDEEVRTNSLVISMFGEARLQQKAIRLGTLSQESMRIDLYRLQRSRFSVYLDLGRDQLEAIEEERKGGDLLLTLNLDLLHIELGPDGLFRRESVRHHSVQVQHANRDFVEIPQSKWIKILGELGYGLRRVVELPADLEQLSKRLKTAGERGLAGRLMKAFPILDIALTMEKEGDWRGVVQQSREILELLSRGTISSEDEGEASSKAAVRKLLVDSGLPEETGQAVTMIIDSLYTFTNPSHHAVGKDGKPIPIAFNREDASLALETTIMLLNLLAAKLKAKTP